LKHLVSFSGGVCSFWASQRVIAEHGPKNVTNLFADTRMEDEDLYRFNQEASEYLGVQMVTVCDGRNPWEVFRDERMIGNPRADLCSRILKRDLLWAWTRKHRDPKTTIVYLGLDWEEEHRTLRTRAANPEWRVEAPMQSRPWWTKEMMLAELQRIGIRPPRLYTFGFPHNNCGGFCIKAGQAHFVHLLRTLPERYQWHEEQEQELIRDLGKDVAILRDRRGGKTKPMSLRALRLRVEAGDWGKTGEQHEWGGCGCAVD
jgi:hypothetical protein